ncbi:Translation initiation factor IF-2 [Penicillium subrubescens]|uniref:Translation initiation factor IF-2, mitochondrial n=1 Tax=Penicillium subrubescens TaxID=1316194 RepID=A0A1Q5T0U2_9EURO|nr:Translation initiation factor IF-2 [Penicillium subrubescens]KAJ5911404.1 Translation initiation factor IF-2 [Penicillium subrubescens]OKO93864.1 Translation initiation factor IF-2, mitochondrial [Penicillium subrubescens]
MHRRVVWRLSRRVDLSTSTTLSSPILPSSRTFRSSASRLNSENGAGDGNSDGAAPSAPSPAPKFGNRWGARQASKPTGLSPAEQALRDAIMARSKPPPPPPEAPKGPDPEKRIPGTQFYVNSQGKQAFARSANHPVDHQHLHNRVARHLRGSSRTENRPSRGNREWTCQSCNKVVFAKHKVCPFCQTARQDAPRPPRQEQQPKKKDWDCPDCGHFNFARRDACTSCGNPRPDAQPSETSTSRRESTRTGKLHSLGQSILAEAGEENSSSAWGSRKTQNDRTSRHGAPTRISQSEGRESRGQDETKKDRKVEEKNEKEKELDKKDQWSWDMSALDQLQSMEAPPTPVDVQKKPKKRDGRKDRGSSEEGDFDPEDRKRRRDKRQKKAKEEVTATPLHLPEFISVSNLADVIGVRQAEFVARMEDMGFEDVTYNHVLDAETAGLVAAEFNYEAIFDTGADDIEAAPVPEDASDLPPRPPVVTIMGHVDHGKTTILDWLRKSSVAATEHGGITQHIGAFSVAMPSGKTITFLDTPGHSAFLEMRKRGADVTDIVVLVVAADDSVKPQTIEAIKHATQANVPIIVAISKIDKEGRNPERVKQDLSVHGVHVEDYGGDVQAIGVSGKTGEGMIELEEAIGVLSEMQDHRADTACNAEGWVIEATTKSYGRVASALIRRGTLRPGDVIVAGQTWARVRTLRNEAGLSIDEATPGMPVEIDGWRDQPVAGTEILQAPTEQKAKDVVAYRQDRADTQKLGEDMVAINEARRELLEKRRQEDQDSDDAASAPVEASGPKAINFIIKADVDGSAEAVLNSIAAVGNNEVYANILRSGVGPVTEFDIEHAASAKGKIISFNMPIDPNMSRLAEQESVTIMDHNIIYKLIDDVKDVLSEHLAPTVTQRVTGEAEVGQIFEITVKGRDKTSIAGCRVRNGLVNKTKKVRVIRGNQTVYDGTMTSLKNVKKDVTEMRKDTECGIAFDGWTDFAVGDHIQCYEEIFEKRHL